MMVSWLSDNRSDHDGSTERLPLLTSTAKPRPRPRRRRFIITVALGVVCSCALLGARYAAGNSKIRTPLAAQHVLPEPISPQLRNPAVLVEAKHGAVASENEVCSKIGVEVMKDGGNAVDSAISTVLCIGVVNMFSSGIGGGGFMTIRVPPSAPGAESEVWEIDFRETAPALANSTMFVGDPTKALFGGLSVGVPGEIRGLGEAHRRWGKLDWARLVQPSVDLAAGWPVGRELARRMNHPFFHNTMLGSSDWSDIFAPDGFILQEGELIQRTNLSRTLATIARNGPDAFYHGEVAQAIVDKVVAEGGILTLDDLAGYKVNVTKALVGTYRNRKVYVPHAPTSGPVFLHMLNLLEHYNLLGEGKTGLNSHRLVEAMKFGFAARTKITDPAFNDDSHRINEISEKVFSDLIVTNLTDDYTHPPAYYNPIFDVPEDHGTSHTSVVDKDGMAASITTTINFVFGSQVLDPVTGIIMNDEMDDFSIPGTPNGFGLWPSPYNYPEPGKRPLSSTVPLIVEDADGDIELVLGGSGGSRIFPAVFQVMLNIDWGYDLSAAIEEGRLHNQLFPLEVDADDTYSPELLDALRIRGHSVTVEPFDRVAAVVNGVMKKDGRLFAASDSRKNGIAAGY